MRNMVLGVTCLTLTFTASLAAAAGPNVSDLIEALKSKDSVARQEAIDLLGAEGPDAADAVPALTKLLQDKSPVIRAHAAQSLGQIGEAAKPAVEELVKLVADKDRVVRREAIEALSAIKPGPEITIPLLTEVMNDSDPAVRIQMLNAVVEHGTDAVPFLIEGLKNEEFAYWACLGLSELGEDAAEAVPALVEALSSERSDVQQEALLALAAIGEPAADATGNIARMLRQEEFAAAATYALGRIGSAPKRVIAKIEANKESGNGVLQTLSLWALARFSPDDTALVTEAAEVLVEKLKSEDPYARQMAAQALADLKPGPAIMSPILEKAFDGADEALVIGALDAIADLGVEMVPRLIEALEVGAAGARAAYILGEIGPEAKDAVPALIKLVLSDDEQAKHEAIFALAKIGPDAKPAVRALIKVLKEGDGEDCHAAAYALGSIGPEAIAAADQLAKALDSDDESLPLVAAWALTKIDCGSPATAPKVVSLLIGGLAEINAETRREAAAGLKCLGPLAKPALPALKAALNDDDEGVRAMAQEAIDAIGK